MTKIQVYKSGAYAIIEKIGTWYVAKAYNNRGDCIDKMRCDDYRMGLEYYKAFKAIARQS